MRTYVIWKFIGIFLVLGAPSIWAAAAGGAAGRTGASEGMDGIILKATLPVVEGAAGTPREIYFVPTHHSTPLEAFSNTFRGEVSKRKALIMESFSTELSYIGALDVIIAKIGEGNIKASYPLACTIEDRVYKGMFMETTAGPRFAYASEEIHKVFEGFHSLILSLTFASQEKLKAMGGFLAPEDPTWSLDAYPEVKAQVETLFKYIYEQAKMCGLETHFAHFQDVYKMKPGVVAGIRYELMMKEGHANGMDAQIAHIFAETEKPRDGLETIANVVESIRPFPVTLDEVRDDFNPWTGHYWRRLLEMHTEGTKELSEATIMGVRAMGKRNKSWMAKYGDLLAKYGDMICVHGQTHFIGKEGLMALGQAAGWQWSLFNPATEDYNPFVYISDSEKPFVALDGTPLDI